MSGDFGGDAADSAAPCVEVLTNAVGVTGGSVDCCGLQVSPKAQEQNRIS